MCVLSVFFSKLVSKIYFTIGGFFLGFNSLYLIIAYAYLFKVVRGRLQHQVSVEGNLTFIKELLGE